MPPRGPPLSSFGLPPGSCGEFPGHPPPGAWREAFGPPPPEPWGEFPGPPPPGGWMPSWQLGLPPGIIPPSTNDYARPSVTPKSQEKKHTNANAPQGTVAGLSRFTVPLPVGWKVAISSTSHKTYNQGVCTEYARNGGKVRNMLASSWDETGTMHEIGDGNDSVIIEQVEEDTALILNFYASQNRFQIKRQLITNKAFVKGISPARTETSDGAIFVVDVHDTAGTRTRDQVVTIVYTLADKLNLANIQGDVLPGLPKALEYFYYFKITDVERFKAVFQEFVLPKIVTSAQLVFNKPPSPRDDPDYSFYGLNVAFTSAGLKLFGLDPAELRDEAFLRGQLADARALGDAGVARGDAWSPEWDPEYKANIDGIFLITAYKETDAQEFIAKLEAAFTWAPRRSSLKKIVSLHGHPRPGAQGINDPFGWRGGGFTNPQVKGITFEDEVQYTGTPVIPMGVIVIGREGDEDANRRPDWAKDGSFIATRKLNCLVPELEKYLAAEGPKVFPSLTPQAAVDKLGARLMGRWKNGTSVEMSPDNDAPEIAKDDKRVNNFTFDQKDVKQQRCPFAAHMRKSNPRNDVPESERLRHLIRRHNMPYGPEVTDEERQNGTLDDRGLHLCAYQSSIERGFRFIQCSWYNNDQFPPNKSIRPGWDPIFGQDSADGVQRYMTGVDPTQPRTRTTFADKFVDPRGGEYFFSPSMATLKDYIAA